MDSDSECVRLCLFPRALDQTLWNLPAYLQGMEGRAHRQHGSGTDRVFRALKRQQQAWRPTGGGAEPSRAQITDVEPGLCPSPLPSANSDAELGGSWSCFAGEVISCPVLTKCL